MTLEQYLEQMQPRVHMFTRVYHWVDEPEDIEQEVTIALIQIWNKFGKKKSSAELGRLGTKAMNDAVRMIARSKGAKKRTVYAISLDETTHDSDETASYPITIVDLHTAKHHKFDEALEGLMLREAVEGLASESQALRVALKGGDVSQKAQTEVRGLIFKRQYIG